MSGFSCNICSKSFKTLQNLQKHLNNKRCKVDLDYNKIHELLKNTSLTYNENPIENLNTSHIGPEILADIIEVHHNNNINDILSKYIRCIIHDMNHPENHAVKYINKKDKLYCVLTKDTSGNIKQAQGKFKDIRVLITGPILLILKKKLKQFKIKYEKDEESKFDYSLYEDEINDLRSSLSDVFIGKILHNVLDSYVITDKRMKVSKT
jgi:hypothetical protein